MARGKASGGFGGFGAGLELGANEAVGIENPDLLKGNVEHGFAHRENPLLKRSQALLRANGQESMKGTPRTAEPTGEGSCGRQEHQPQATDCTAWLELVSDLEPETVDP